MRMLFQQFLSIHCHLIYGREEIKIIANEEASYFTLLCIIEIMQREEQRSAIDFPNFIGVNYRKNCLTLDT